MSEPNEAQKTAGLGHETAAELVAAWDRGEPIWSVSMGGFGPGYEQAIQVLAVEFTRAALAKGWVKTGDHEKDADSLKEVCDARLAEVEDRIPGGVSGGIYSGAFYITAKWLYWGPRELIAQAHRQGKGDRCIQVSREPIDASKMPPVRP